MKNRLTQEGIEMKIKASTTSRKHHLEKYGAIDKNMKSTYTMAAQQLHQFTQDNPEEYKALWKDLIVQALIKIYEPKVFVCWKESDEEMIKEVIDEAAEEYKEKMAKEVVELNGEVPDFELHLDSSFRLPPYDKENPHSCIGGVVLHALDGKIAVRNTLEERLETCYQDSQGTLRKIMYPMY